MELSSDFSPLDLNNFAQVDVFFQVENVHFVVLSGNLTWLVGESAQCSR